MEAALQGGDGPIGSIGSQGVRFSIDAAPPAAAKGGSMKRIVLAAAAAAGLAGCGCSKEEQGAKAAAPADVAMP